MKTLSMGNDKQFQMVPDAALFTLFLSTVKSDKKFCLNFARFWLSRLAGFSSFVRKIDIEQWQILAIYITVNFVPNWD